MAARIQLVAYVTRLRRAMSVLCVVALATLATVPASAQKKPDANETRALELFDTAAERFREGRFREAIELLDEANRLKPSAILHYNKARAYEGLGENETAIGEYQKYLEREPTAADRGAVERRIATLRQGIDERARLERERMDAERARAKPDTPEPAPASAKPSVVPWIVAGVGLFVVGTGVYFGLRAKSEERAGDDASSQADAEAHEADGQRFARIANVAWIAGGAVTVTGVVWGLVDMNASATASARPRFGLGLRPTSAGLGLSGRF